MKQSFGDFLAEKRKNQNLTQKKLANELFVSESAVCKWEKNIAHPDITLLPKLCKILNVTEHELITASEDTSQREIAKKAKRWTNLVSTLDIFFIIGYGLTLLTCFIVNLATAGTLNWFWLVFFSILLSASFTSFPKYIKKFKLLIISLVQLVLLIMLLGICCIYTNGTWFWVSVLPIICGFAIVFIPIYISNYNIPQFIKRHNAVFSIILDFILLFIMCFVIELYTKGVWLISIAFPLMAVGLILTLFMVFIIRYTKFNKLLKTGSIIFGWLGFLIGEYFLTKAILKKELNITIDEFTYPNFLNWSQEQISSNVIALLLFTILSLALIFTIIGLIKQKKS